MADREIFWPPLIFAGLIYGITTVAFILATMIWGEDGSISVGSPWAGIGLFAIIYIAALVGRISGLIATKGGEA